MPPPMSPLQKKTESPHYSNKISVNDKDFRKISLINPISLTKYLMLKEI